MHEILFQNSQPDGNLERDKNSGKEFVKLEQENIRKI